MPKEIIEVNEEIKNRLTKVSKDQGVAMKYISVECMDMGLKLFENGSISATKEVIIKTSKKIN